MIKEFTATGKTIEEATQLAKLGLAAPLTADVKTEVIQMPKKGFLGFGSKPAEVKVSYDDGKSEKKAPKKKPAKKQSAKKDAPKQSTAVKKDAPAKESQKIDTPASVKKENKAEPKKERDYPQSVDLEYAKNYLAQIVKGLEIDDANITATYEDGVVTMDLECEDYGIIIGRRGETLDSIQYLLSLAMKKNSNGYVRVAINIGNYREKRNETLKHLAKKNAAYVLRTGRRYTFEPMNPYERRVIHTTIQEIEGVDSRSIGYNQDRRVVIEPVGGVKPRQSAPRRNNSRPQSSAPAKRVDRASGPKFGKIEVNKD
jgi:spoIIIJ-associated protein